MKKMKALYRVNFVCSVFTRAPEGEVPQLEARMEEWLARLEITHDWVLKTQLKTNITKS